MNHNQRTKRRIIRAAMACVGYGAAFALFVLGNACTIKTGGAAAEASDTQTVAHQAARETYTIVSWNVESGDANPDTLAKTMQYIQQTYGPIDVWGLSEVSSATWAVAFKHALGDHYRFELGTTGGADRLCVLYDQTKFALAAPSQELNTMNPGGRVRSPLVVTLTHKASADTFLVMVNHLYRSKADARQRQAKMLNQWIQNINQPLIAVGDYNFDYNIAKEKGNKAFGLLIANQHFTWVRPDTLVRSQCNKHYNSVLDFVFLNDDALAWPVRKSQILVRPNDCRDTKYTSDHRPVIAWLGYTTPVTIP